MKSFLLFASLLMACTIHAQSQEKINYWEIGLNTTNSRILGDVQERNGISISPLLSKNFAKWFALRGQISLGSIKGVNNNPSEVVIEDTWRPGLVGDDEIFGSYNDFDTPDYRDLGYVFQNYRTNYLSFQLRPELILRSNKFYFSNFIGWGKLSHRTKINQLDSNGKEYDYSGVLSLVQDHAIDQKETVKLLSELRDNTYESQAEFDEDYPFTTILSFGFRLSYEIMSNLEMALLAECNWTDSDLLDGDRWTNWGAESRDNDSILHLGISINYLLKSNESKN